MKYTTTDGKTHYIEVYCSYCELDTAGNHKSWCPNHPANFKIYDSVIMKRQKSPEIDDFVTLSTNLVDESQKI